MATSRKLSDTARTRASTSFALSGPIISVFSSMVVGLSRVPVPGVRRQTRLVDGIGAIRGVSINKRYQEPAGGPWLQNMNYRQKVDGSRDRYFPGMWDDGLVFLGARIYSYPAATTSSVVIIILVYLYLSITSWAYCSLIQVESRGIRIRHGATWPGPAQLSHPPWLSRERHDGLLSRASCGKLVSPKTGVEVREHVLLCNAQISFCVFRHGNSRGRRNTLSMVVIIPVLKWGRRRCFTHRRCHLVRCSSLIKIPVLDGMPKPDIEEMNSQ
jgi:hypothetical protein